MTAPLHERVATLAKETRLDAADMGGRGRHVRCRELLDHAAMLDEAAAALRPPEGEVGALCGRIEGWVSGGLPLHAEDVRAALAHLRRLAAVLREIADFVPPPVAEIEPYQAIAVHLKRTARRALAPAPAAEPAR